MKTPADIVNQLRLGVDMSDLPPAQIIYEKWLKSDLWEARAIALPLIVGCDPEQWQAYLATHKLAATEELLWHILANDLSVEQVEGVSVSQVTEWSRVQTVNMHPSFLRIYEFLRKVLIASAAQDNSSSQRATNKIGADGENGNGAGKARAEEREIILGAALSLLAKMPEKCRDANGFVDGDAIVGLIEQTAARWFPQSAPTLTRADMVTLIDKWLE